MALLIDEAGMLAKSIKAGSHGHQQSLMNFMTSTYGLGLSEITARVYHDKKKLLKQFQSRAQLS